MMGSMWQDLARREQAARFEGLLRQHLPAADARAALSDGGDGADSGFGQQGGSGRVLAEEAGKLGVQLGDLAGQEPDPGGDRAQGQDGGPMVGAGACRAGELADAVKLAGGVIARSWQRRSSGAATIRLLSSLIALVRLTTAPWRVTRTWRSASRRPLARGTARCSPASAARAAWTASARSFLLLPRGPLHAGDLRDVLAGPAQDCDQAGGEAAGALQRPDPPAGCLPPCPGEQPAIPGPSAVSVTCPRTEAVAASSTARPIVSRSGSPPMT
ncbi:MAG: hypothetical protein ACRDNZ_24460 [Streptosporangiaceae bacterium]